jgi:Amt family ammonium transporter
VIGVVSGLLVVVAVLVVERRFKVDDPVGAVAVHGANGLWGVIAVGLFADGKYGDGLNSVAGGVKGLFTGGGVDQLLAQLTDAIVLVIFCSLMTIVFFTLMKRANFLRSDPDHEVAGLDLPEMGAMAYPDFLEAQGSVFIPNEELAGVGAGADTGAPRGAAKFRSEVGA